MEYLEVDNFEVNASVPWVVMEHLHNAHRRQTLPLGIGMMEIMENKGIVWDNRDK